VTLDDERVERFGNAAVTATTLLFVGTPFVVGFLAPRGPDYMGEFFVGLLKGWAIAPIPLVAFFWWHDCYHNRKTKK
jgi:hypothetical protein